MKPRKSILFLIALCLCGSVANAQSKVLSLESKVGSAPAPPVALRTLDQRLQTSDSTAAAVAPLVTNKPLVVEFDPPQPIWFTNLAAQFVTNSVSTNASMVWDTRTVSTPRFAFKPITNLLITCTVGTNENFAITNRTGIITNRGPVTFSVSPTNKYTVILWGLQSDKQLAFLSSQIFPLAPSNVVTFLMLPTFSSDLAVPRHKWRRGSSVVAFSVTNLNEAGLTNEFMGAEVTVVRDDFTPKSVQFDANTYKLLPIPE